MGLSHLKAEVLASKVMDTMDIIYIAFEMVIAVFSILGNILIIWAVRLNPAFQKNIFYFISSLALADIAVGLVMPVAIVVNFGFEMPFPVCLFMCCLLVVFTQASILSLLAIAIDRYMIVKLLTRYQVANSRKKIYAAIGTVWLLSLLLGFVVPFWWEKERLADTNGSKCEFVTTINQEYLVYVSFLVGTLIPLTLMCLLYGRIFWIIHTKLKQSSVSLGGSKAFYRQQYKTAKSLTLVLSLFAVCWLPLCIMNCISLFNHREFTKDIIYMGILLTHSNSIMNPIVYAFRIKKFRKTCICILRTHILRMDPNRSQSQDTSTTERS